jgi:hypothetical protein
VSEAEFTRMAIQLAKLRGWRVAHFRAAVNRRGRWSTPVQGDGAGFPDLLLVRGDCVLAIELKVGRNRPSPAQREWLAAFAAAGVRAVVARPEDWAMIEEMLT